MSKPLKEGYLVKAHPKEGIFAVTVWQKRYFILWPTGTMEYYTSYQKLPEEYCSTMDLKETIDILAPVSVGKKHNVIKLTVKKNNKDKDYWLDCDCPTLLNEWVRCMVNVAGLSPEDQDDCFASNDTGTTDPHNHQQRRLNKPSDAAKRRLPSLPMVMNMEYEIPNKEGEFYEEISPVHSPVPDDDSNKPRRYSKTIGVGGVKQNIKGTEVVKNDMLKRSPLPMSDGGSPSPTTNLSSSGSLPTDIISTSPPPNVPIRGIGTVNHQELQRRLSIRKQELYDAVGNQVSQDGEEYEEVQFNAEITVGDRSTPGGVKLRNKQPMSRNKDEVNPKQCNIPVKPAWDSTLLSNISSSNPDSEDIPSKRPAMTVPLRDSVLLEMSGGNDFSSPPPIPPRETNNSSSSPPLYIQHGVSSSPPPPVPDRASIGSKRPKIQSYYTTEIKTPPNSVNDPPSMANGYNSESDQSSSGDSVVIRPTSKLMASSTHGGGSQPLSLLATVIGPGSKPAPPSGKPAPPSTKAVKPSTPGVKPNKPGAKPIPLGVKPIPLGVKPTPPGIKPKPSTSPPTVRPKPNLKDNKSNPPPLVAKKPQQTKSMAELKTNSTRGDAHFHVNRAPAKLPKPAKVSPTLPIKDSTLHSAMNSKKKQISAPTVLGSPELPRRGVTNHAPPLPSKHNTGPTLPPRNGPLGPAPLINKEVSHTLSSKPLPSKPHPPQANGGDLKHAVKRPPMPLPKS